LPEKGNSPDVLETTTITFPEAETMSGTKKGSKAPRDTGKGADSAEIDTSAGANDDSEGTSAPKESKGAAKGDSTGKSGPLVNTGADALPNATRAAPAARPPKEEKTKELFLDQPYTLHGRHYPASAHPGDLVKVPQDFPEHILPNGGEAPSNEEWAKQVRATPPSAVIEVPDESGKTL
jgi:hypothetical protein